MYLERKPGEPMKFVVEFHDEGAFTWVLSCLTGFFWEPSFNDNAGLKQVREILHTNRVLKEGIRINIIGDTNDK
jgi:hypothetical protein